MRAVLEDSAQNNRQSFSRFFWSCWRLP